MAQGVVCLGRCSVFLKTDGNLLFCVQQAAAGWQGWVQVCPHWPPLPLCLADEDGGGPQLTVDLPTLLQAWQASPHVVWCSSVSCLCVWDAHVSWRVGPLTTRQWPALSLVSPRALRSGLSAGGGASALAECYLGFHLVHSSGSKLAIKENRSFETLMLWNKWCAGTEI